MKFTNSCYQPPLDQGLSVLYCDNSILVIEKPTGLLSVPGKGEDKQDCLLSRVKVQFPDALVVHRLDMETSGVMVFARSKQIHRELSDLFQKREVQKRYIAVVDGRIPDAVGVIDLPLICDWPNRPLQKVDYDIGKPSVTRYKVITRDTEKNITRVELEPETGRSHQLRVHMQSLGHPILGDPLYSKAQQKEKAPRLLLHSQSLAFIHPGTQEPVRFISEPPF